MAMKTVKRPTEASLHDHALFYLGRYAATEAGLVRVLDRKIAAWARTAPAEADGVPALRAAARAVAAQLVAAGAINDAAFASNRARSLSRAGRSRLAIGAHLAAKGVARETAATANSQDPAREVAAAVIFARKRRFGGFRTVEDTPERRTRELAAFARGGFSQAVASRVMRMRIEEATAMIAAFRASD